MNSWRATFCDLALTETLRPRSSCRIQGRGLRVDSRLRAQGLGRRGTALCQLWEPLQDASNNRASSVKQLLTPSTRWSTTLSSKVNLQYAFNSRALCGGNVVMQHPKTQGEPNPRAPPCGEFLHVVKMCLSKAGLARAAILTARS